MNYLISVIFGVIQGITEFLPISSSGHLILLHDIYPLELLNSLGFDVALHIGTLIALIIYFYKDISKYVKAFFISFTNWNIKNDQNQRLSWFLVLSTIPAIIAALLFNDLIETALRSASVVAITLIIGAILFILVEFFSKQNKSVNDVGLWRTIFIGTAQAFALIPGLSRSGITITAGLATNLDREAATRFSFLISIPIIFLAGVKKSYDLAMEGLVYDQLILYAIGIIISSIVGYLSIKYFLLFVKKFSLNWFALYRIILAILIIIFIK